jgi:hypothetical protein
MKPGDSREVVTRPGSVSAFAGCQSSAMKGESSATRWRKFRSASIRSATPLLET